jgi:hypothetical protein
MTTNQNSPSRSEPVSPRVEGRHIVSAPARAIEVERVRVSDTQRSSVASAFRTGRAEADRDR